MERPQQLENQDFSKVAKLCREYIEELDREDYVDDDLETYIFEAAIEAVFGKDVWIWINKRLK